MESGIDYRILRSMNKKHSMHRREAFINRAQSPRAQWAWNPSTQRPWDLACGYAVHHKRQLQKGQEKRIVEYRLKKDVRAQLMGDDTTIIRVQSVAVLPGGLLELGGANDDLGQCHTGTCSDGLDMNVNSSIEAKDQARIQPVEHEVATSE